MAIDRRELSRHGVGLMMVHRRCQPCGCDELPPPDCFGCSPPNEPVTWDMDFPAAMTYDVGDEETDTYIDTGVGTCSDLGFVAEEYSITRDYPDISTLGSGNICYREHDRPCAWGFFHGIAYGIKRTAAETYFACGDGCELLATASTYGSASNVTNRYKYSAPHVTNQEALDTLAAARPGDCGDVNQCGTGLWAWLQPIICGDGYKFGYAGLLQYMPLTSELVLTIRWIPRILATVLYKSTYDGGRAFESTVSVPYISQSEMDLGDGPWGKCWGNVFPNATSTDQLIAGTQGSDQLSWRYSAVVDCTTDFDGLPIVLSLIDSAAVLVQHYRWAMVDTPATITVTPNF